MSETWDLRVIFASDVAWEAERAALLADIALLKPLKGRLAASPASLLAGMDRISRAKQRLDRLHSAARLAADQDTSAPAAQAKLQQADDVSAAFDAAISFVAVEIAAVRTCGLDRLLAAEPRLDRHEFSLREIIRLAEHILSDEAESVLAAARSVQAGPAKIYRLLATRRGGWAEIMLSNDSRVLLKQESFAAQMQSPNRSDRRLAFGAYFESWTAYEELAGGLYCAHLHASNFEAKARKYPSALALCLAEGNIPESIYHTMIAQARAGLPTLHRYLDVKRRRLGVAELYPFDLVAPLAPGHAAYSLQQAKQLTLRAVRPLGEQYQAELAAGFAGRWMDAGLRPGKISGAYQDGAVYDLHPFVMLNFNATFASVSALAHEWGHAMHTVYANRAQPFENAEYSLFLAEVPATLHEMLLIDVMIETASSTQEKLFYLGQALELLRGTFFMQAEHAEFELTMHEAEACGDQLSGAELSQAYLAITRSYLGDAEGVTNVPEAYGVRWAHLPHLYRDYYCYQYATSIAAAGWFMQRLKTGNPAESERFLAMLQAGGSAHPADILQRAGLDLASPAPYQAIVERMEDLTYQIEQLPSI